MSGVGSVRGVARWGRRTGFQVVGWVLLLVGIAALVLPGPGLLLMFAGMAVLARENEWAERQLEPVKKRAFAAAAEGVKTWPRIIGSCLSAGVVTGLGVLWIVQPPAPGWWPLRESWWLLGGAGAGISLLVSGLIAYALIVYSYRQFRGAATDPGTDERAVAREAARPDQP